MAKIVLLGPQRPQPTLHEAVESQGLSGSIAAVTAGWEEREHEDDELAAHLGESTTNLELYRRSREILSEDRAISDALGELRRARREAQDLYRHSLHHALGTVRALAARPGNALVEEELAEAFDVVRALDARHLDRIARLEGDFRRRWATGRRAAVRRQRQQVDDILSQSDAVVVAGGHVGVLAEALLLFGFEERLRRRTVLAWSAGAMTLGSRIVLFHDSPPQGFGNAEVWGPGLDLYNRFLPFPNARVRLDTDDRQRVSILARRFLPQICVPLDAGERLDLSVGRAVSGSSARRLERSGDIAGLGS